MKSSVQLVTLCLLALLQVNLVQSWTTKIVNVWLRRPYRGPECVVEIVGIDLDETANRRFDMWTKPDVQVICRHNGKKRSTQIEGNTYRPRFLWQAKIPWNKKKGFGFTVYDTNVLKENEVIGRTFINAEKANELIESEEPAVMKIGDGVGSIMINLYETPEFLKENIGDSEITE